MGRSWALGTKPVKPKSSAGNTTDSSRKREQGPVHGATLCNQKEFERQRAAVKDSDSRRNLSSVGASANSFVWGRQQNPTQKATQVQAPLEFSDLEQYPGLSA